MSITDFMVNQVNRWFNDEELVELSVELGKEAAQKMAEQLVNGQMTLPVTSKKPPLDSSSIPLNQSYQPIARRSWFAVVVVSLIEAQFLFEPAIEPLLLAA